MEDFQCSNVVTDNCANCNLTFGNDVVKATKVTILDNASQPSASEVQILDALLYIYGLSYEDFAQVFPQNPDEIKNNFTDTGGNGVALCLDCLQVFQDIYGMHIKFENLSKEDSILRKVIQWRRNHKLSVKKEPECTEDHNENEDFYDSWTSNFDESMAEGEDNEPIRNGSDFFEGSNDQTTEDVKNIDLFGHVQKIKTSKSIGHRQRGRPKKVKTKEKLILKISKRHIQPKAEIENSIEYENDSKLQPYIRLTRSKVPGSELKKKTFRRYMENDDVSSSGSDYEDKHVKKKKPSAKQRMILKKYRDKPLMATQSGGMNSNVKDEEVDGIEKDTETPGTSSGASDSQSNSTKKFIKIRPENGKRLVYICNLCGKSITRIKLFKVHMNAHKKAANKEKRAVRKKVKCPHCDKLCKNEDSLKIHESNHHSKAPKICDKCGKTFMRMESLKLHQRFSHTDDKQFECKTCGMKYKWKGSLQSHELTHKNPRPHVCERCGMTFANKSNLNRHKTYHEDEEQDKELFRCQDCGKVLKNRKSLKKHINGTHREDLQKIFTCPICGKTTKTKPNLRAHMKIHDPNRVTKRKSELVRNPIVRTASETVIQSQLQVPLPPPSNFQIPTGVWY